MKKHEILKILRIFCVFKRKGITETQNLLHNILFESEKGTKIFLPFKFKDNKLIMTLENDNEVSCEEIKEDI